MLRCARCKTALPWGVFDTPNWARCPVCGSLFRMLGFPAAFRASAAARSEGITLEGESSCYYHSHKRALRPCDGCGRFLCSLCDIELGERHLCVACLESGKRKGQLSSLENHRLRYDKIALEVALLPPLLLFTIGLTIFTAPAAIFIALRYWKSPSSVVARSKVRLVVAILAASLQMGGWFWLAIFILRRRLL
jgi:hypothetical protein